MSLSTSADTTQNWLDHLRRQGKSGHTIRAYARALRHFYEWYQLTYGESFTPDKVMPRDVRDWKARQQTVEGAAPATVNQCLVAVIRFFRWASRQKLCQKNPAEDVSTVRLLSIAARAVPAPVRLVLRAVAEDVIGRARAGELLGMSWRACAEEQQREHEVDLAEEMI